jgi:hypothetical protein
MNFRKVLAIAVALGVALVPAAASASTAPTVYTTNYAGYYATGNFGNKVDFFSEATLPTLASAVSTYLRRVARAVGQG